MIGTGDYLRGPELQNSAISRNLDRAWQVIKDAAGDWREGETPGLIVLFVVPGSLGDADFTGQRVTLFSRKKKLVQIEAAVPRELVCAERIGDFVIGALRQAAQTAAEVFAKKKAGVFDLAKASAIIDKVQEELANDPGGR